MIRDMHRTDRVERVEQSNPECARLEAKIARYEQLMKTDLDCAAELRMVTEKLRNDIARIRRQAPHRHSTCGRTSRGAGLSLAG
jgi:hypothetical protein